MGEVDVLVNACLQPYAAPTYVCVGVWVRTSIRKGGGRAVRRLVNLLLGQVLGVIFNHFLYLPKCWIGTRVTIPHL